MQKIVKVNLPPGRIVNKRQSVVELMDGLSASESLIYAWFRGECTGKKHLHIDVLKLFLEKYYGKRGLRTNADLRRWLDSGPEEYLPLLRDPDVLKWQKERKIQPGIFLKTINSVDRPVLEKLIYGKLASEQIVILKGPPGVGKTLLLEKVFNDAALHIEYDALLFLTDSTGGVTLHQWMEQTLRVLDVPYDSDDDLERHLRFTCSRRKFFFLVDNLLQPDFLILLQSLITPHSKILVATRESKVLSRLPATCEVIDVGKFTDEETASFAKLMGVTFANVEQLRMVGKSVNFNPLGLRIVTRLSKQHGWESVMHALGQVPPSEPVGVEVDLFLPIYLAFQMLDKELQIAFIQVGAMPYLTEYDLSSFSALWNIDEDRASGWLMSLGEDCGLFEKLKDGGWVIHEQIWRYANSMLHQLDRSHFADAQNWVKKASSYSDIQAWYKYEFSRLASMKHLYSNLMDAKNIDQTKRQIGSEYRSSLRWVFWSILRRMFIPWLHENSPWMIMKVFSSSFTSRQYLHGYYLDQIERRWNLPVSLFIWSCVLLLILPKVPFHNLGIVPGYCSSPVLILGLAWFVLSFARSQVTFFMMWSNLWMKRKPDDSVFHQ